MLVASAAPSVRATPLTAGEVRYLIFSKSTNGPFSGVWFFPISVDAAHTLVIAFYAGLNLTGGLMGTFAGSSGADDLGTGSGLADGEFSTLVRWTAGTPSFGDEAGNVTAYWVNASGYGGTSGGQIATDDRPPVTSPPTGSENNVPEPGSAWPCLAAGAALGAVRRHRRAKR